jgi:hypothetical protein
MLWTKGFKQNQELDKFMAMASKTRYIKTNNIPRDIPLTLESCIPRYSEQKDSSTIKDLTSSEQCLPRHAI